MSATTPPQTTLRSERQGAIARLVIDDPASRNGLTAESCRALAAALHEAVADPEVRAIVLTGAGGHFCSGANLRAAASLMGASADELHAHVRHGFHAIVEALQTSPKPTLAVIRGACVGFGFDMALSCDLRLSADDAKFGQVFTRLGLVPDGGSSYTLPRLVGLGRAMELMLLADTFDGRQAAEWQLVNRAVPDADLDAVAGDWASRLAAGPPLAFARAKRNLLAGAAGGTLAEALDREAAAQTECLQSEDLMRGVRAFFAKGKPEFVGR